MKKNIRILMATILMLTCFSSGAYAEDIITGTCEVKTYDLTLEDAITMALENNPQLEALDITNKSHKVNLDAAKINKRRYKDIPVSASSFEVMYVKNGYYVDTYEMLIRLNEKEKIKTEETIKYNVIEAYYNYKLSNELVSVTENAYNLSVENLNSMEKRYELGMISQIDYDTVKLSVKNVKSTLDKYKRNDEIAKENLKIILGITEDCVFNLTDGI